MRHPNILRLLACLLPLNLYACCEVATLPEHAGIGPHPMLLLPKHTLLPTVNIAPAKGWPAGVPSAHRIMLLRDENDDGIAETRTIFLQGLNSPFGMTLVGNIVWRVVPR